MRIIGSADSTWIVEITKDELANLAGYGSEYQMRQSREIKVGQCINVSRMYEYLHQLGDGRKRLKEAADTLRKLADDTELVSPFIPVKNQEK